jgi:hypothetical protein
MFKEANYFYQANRQVCRPRMNHLMLLSLEATLVMFRHNDTR